MQRRLAFVALAFVAVACWFAATPEPETPAPEGLAPAGAPTPAPAPKGSDQLRKLKEAWQASQVPEQGDERDTDSEVWMDFFESVLEPAMSTGSATGGSIEHLFSSDEARNEALWGHSCYAVAHGDPRHPAWQVFLRWVQGEADLAEVKGACTRRLPSG